MCPELVQNKEEQLFPDTQHYISFPLSIKKKQKQNIYIYFLEKDPSPSQVTNHMQHSLFILLSDFHCI